MTADDTIPRWRKYKPYMMTQDELLSELAAVGEDVTLSQLQDWAYEARVLPHPVKQKPPGATKGGALALYPAVAFYLALDVARGMSIADARATLEDRTTQYQAYYQSLEERLGMLPYPLVEETYRGWPSLPIALRSEALEYANRVGKHLEKSGEQAVRVTLRIYVETAARSFHTDIGVETPKVPKKRTASETDGGKH